MKHCERTLAWKGIGACHSARQLSAIERKAAAAVAPFGAKDFYSISEEGDAHAELNWNVPAANVAGAIGALRALGLFFEVYEMGALDD